MITPSFAFEQVAAKLEPFDLMNKTLASKGTSSTKLNNLGSINPDVITFDSIGIDTTSLGSIDLDHIRGFSQDIPLTSSRQDQMAASTQDALQPILQTQGLVFPYNPTISEGIQINYDSMELTHSNESFFSYRSTENVRITISDCVWTCDTFENAVYTLSVLHFLRSYSFMDFGMGRSGKPPSPMWFSAYGNFAYNRIPCLLEKADWSFPKDIDYVGVPEFGSQEFMSGSLNFNKNISGAYTWLPIKFTVNTISLIVQHNPKYWTQWNLDDYKSGKMLQRDGGSFHNIPFARRFLG